MATMCVDFSLETRYNMTRAAGVVAVPCTCNPL